MRINMFRILLFVITLFPGMAYCGDTVITVHDAWIREAPPNAVSLAGYMVIENPSDKKQLLVKATSDVFGMIMIHRTVHEGGMARMKHQNTVPILAKGSTVFEPNGYHLMLMRPNQSIRAGDKITINLIFDDSSQLGVGFEVRKGAPMKGGKGEMKCGGRGGMKCGGM